MPRIPIKLQRFLPLVFYSNHCDALEYLPFFCIVFIYGQKLKCLLSLFLENIDFYYTNNTVFLLIYCRAVQETGDISPSLKEDRTAEDDNESTNKILAVIDSQPDDTS